jgi:hypothetical protein
MHRKVLLQHYLPVLAIAAYGLIWAASYVFRDDSMLQLAFDR